MIQRMLPIWSMIPLPFLKPTWTSGSSRFTYCWSLAWRILRITVPVETQELSNGEVVCVCVGPVWVHVSPGMQAFLCCVVCVYPCVLESSSSSQGISLKRWAVSVENDAASDSRCGTACLFQVSGSLLYFDKSIRSEVWLQFPLTHIYCLQKSLLPFKQSSCFSDSLRIVFTIYYLLPLMCPISNLWLHCNSCLCLGCIPHSSVYFLSF